MKRMAFDIGVLLVLAVAAVANSEASGADGSAATAVAAPSGSSSDAAGIKVSSVGGPDAAAVKVSSVGGSDAAGIKVSSVGGSDAVGVKVSSAGGSDAAGVAPAPPDYVFCTVCHGAHGNGNPAINAPKIAGIEPWYLKQQLASFRAGTRGTSPDDEPGMEMQPVGLQLDDTAIDAVAAYVAKFIPVTPPVTVQGDLKRGRTLYVTCSGCHGSNAEGNSALKAPALAGQTDWYLVRQLERFRSGERGFAAEDAPGNTMREAAAALPGTEAVNDLVAYINTLSAKHRGT